MKKFMVGFGVLMVGIAGGAHYSRACDACSTFVALAPWETVRRASVSVFEQYSKYDRPQAGGDEFESYTTQLAAGYRMSERWAFQVGLPYLDRTLNDESESGIGDVTAIVAYRVLTLQQDANVGLLDVYGGVKMPTGNSDRLQEDRDHALAEQQAGAELPHSHGHDLALGSGSWDGIAGMRGLIKRGRVQGLADGQYNLRSEGDFDFEYGDEITWRAGLQYYVMLRHSQSLAAGVDVTGEWHDDNKVLGEREEEPNHSAAYAGPAFTYTWRDRLTLAAAYDLPIEGTDEGLHGAADRRVRGSLAYLF